MKQAEQRLLQILIDRTFAGLPGPLPVAERMAQALSGQLDTPDLTRLLEHLAGDGPDGRSVVDRLSFDQRVVVREFLAHLERFPAYPNAGTIRLQQEGSAFWSGLIGEVPAAALLGSVYRESVLQLLHGTFDRREAAPEAGFIPVGMFHDVERDYWNARFAGKDWWSVEPELLRQSATYFRPPLVTPEAFSYYLPAYLFAAFEPDKELVRSELAASLTAVVEEGYHHHLAGLGAHQRGAVALALAYLAGEFKTGELVQASRAWSTSVASRQGGAEDVIVRSA